MENPIRIQIPISLTYPALEEVLKKKMVGEFIPPGAGKGTGAQPYAQILDIRIEGTSSGGNEIIIGLKIRILRTVLKRDEVNLLVLANVFYDAETQILFVDKYKLSSRTPSGFFNSSLEVLANRVAYNQIIRRARVNLGKIISRGLMKTNEKLLEGLALKGIKLQGEVNLGRITEIITNKEEVKLTVELEGKLEAEIEDLLNLIPPNAL